MRKTEAAELSPFRRLCATGLFLLVLVGPRFVAAQTRHVTNDAEVLPEVQAEYALEGDNYGWLGLSGPVTASHNGGLRNIGLRVGYEHFWNTTWSGGGLLRFATYKSYRGGSDTGGLVVDLAPEAYLRHWNTFGGFNFRQRLGLEYYVPAGEAKSRALVGLRLDLSTLR